jgi:hypothetical protein
MPPLPPPALSSPRNPASPPGEQSAGSAAPAAAPGSTQQQEPRQAARLRIVAPPNSRMHSRAGSEASSPRIMAEPPPELRGSCRGAPLLLPLPLLVPPGLTQQQQPPVDSHPIAMPPSSYPVGLPVHTFLSLLLRDCSHGVVQRACLWLAASACRQVTTLVFPPLLFLLHLEGCSV